MAEASPIPPPSLPPSSPPPTSLPPSRPQLAVSAAIFRDDKILLVRRARSPAKGFYSLPGGRVEFGESLHAALLREVDEETGLNIEIAGLAGWREVLPGATGGGHYLIMSFAARWAEGEVVLNEELDDFKWLAPDALTNLKLGDPRLGDPRLGDPRLDDPRLGDLKPDDLKAGDLKLTGGLIEIIEAAQRLIRA